MMSRSRRGRGVGSEAIFLVRDNSISSNEEGVWGEGEGEGQGQGEGEGSETWLYIVYISLNI